MTKIHVLRAAAGFDEWDAVRALILDAFAYMDDRIDPPSSASSFTPDAMAADAAKGALFLARDGAPLVGCMFAYPKADALYLHKLAVRPDMQGRGVGASLVDAARIEAGARGLGFLELQTRIELTENHAAFARMGFTKTGETAHQGYARPTSITMRAPLTGAGKPG